MPDNKKIIRIPIGDNLKSLSNLPIGRQGENNVLRLIFDLSEWIKYYPQGLATLRIVNSNGNEYPASTIQEGNEVIWDITDIDTAYVGISRCQLDYTFEDGKAKSFIFNAVIGESLVGGGEPPEELTQRWIDKLIEEAEKVNRVVTEGIEDINEAVDSKKEELEQIKSDADEIAQSIRDDADEGKFDGKDGEDGKTPVKGEDYFTPQEIQEIEDSILDKTYDKETIDEKISHASEPSDYNELKEKVENKVDKIDGKGLSTNDYDDSAKTKVDAIPENPKYTDTIYDDTQIREDIDKKVDKVEGKSLSTNDYDNVSKAKVDAIPSDPKYTDTVYDDSEIREELDKKTEKTRIDFNGAVFTLNGEILNFKQLHDIHLEKPDFAFVVYGDRAYLLSYVQDDETSMREMRWESSIATTTAVKTSGIYVTSTDGINIANVSVRDINSENQGNKISVINENNKSNINNYPSNKAVVDYIAPIEEDITSLNESLTKLEERQGGIKWTVEDGILYAEYEEV